MQQLFLRYVKHGASDDRELSEHDYKHLGGVAGSIRTKADEVYQSLEDDQQRQTLRRVLLRMVTLEGGEPARRRVPLVELDYPDDAENHRVNLVLNRLLQARLIVRGITPDGDNIVEPAHDQLLRGWGQYWDWIQKDKENIILLRRLTEAAQQWQAAIEAEAKSPPQRTPASGASVDTFRTSRRVVKRADGPA
jgi:hypothetical protein